MYIFNFITFTYYSMQRTRCVRLINNQNWNLLGKILFFEISIRRKRKFLRFTKLRENNWWKQLFLSDNRCHYCTEKSKMETEMTIYWHSKLNSTIVKVTNFLKLYLKLNIFKINFNKTWNYFHSKIFFSFHSKMKNNKNDAFRKKKCQNFC